MKENVKKEIVEKRKSYVVHTLFFIQLAIFALFEIERLFLRGVYCGGILSDRTQDPGYTLPCSIHFFSFLILPIIILISIIYSLETKKRVLYSNYLFWFSLITFLVFVL